MSEEAEIPHFNTTEVIGEGWFPDEPRVLAIWHADATETPMAINHAGLTGNMKPNTLTLMPEVVASTLVEHSGFNVEIQFNAIVNAGVDEAIDEAVAMLEASRAKGAELAKLTVERLAAELPNCDLNDLRFALEAEEASRKRASAIAAIEAAIDGHPDQIAALEAARADVVRNEFGDHQTS